MGPTENNQQKTSNTRSLKMKYFAEPQNDARSPGFVMAYGDLPDLTPEDTKKCRLNPNLDAFIPDYIFYESLVHYNTHDYFTETHMDAKLPGFVMSCGEVPDLTPEDTEKCRLNSNSDAFIPDYIFYESLVYSNTYNSRLGEIHNSVPHQD